jgi:hypothetical protein
MKDSFVTVLAGPSGNQQWTFHRPIGHSGIVKPESAWVATYTPEVAFLLERKEPPSWKTWSSKRDQAIKAMLLAVRGNGRYEDADGETRWDFVGSGRCGAGIKQFQQTAEAAGKAQHEWLSFAPEAVQAQEAVWISRRKAATPPAAWVTANPCPTALTLGGPLGTVKQESVAYLEGKDHRSARDVVMRRILGITTP